MCLISRFYLCRTLLYFKCQQANHAIKIKDRLTFLDVALTIDDMDKPGYELHDLTGSYKDRWAVSVSGNWRITFEFKDGDAYVVDYEDYH